jgi:hypothetical protein
MTLNIIDRQSHGDQGPLVTLDDLDRGRCMVAMVLESVFFAAAARTDCEAFAVEPQARGRLHSEEYDTEALVRVIKKFIREKPE